MQKTFAAAALLALAASAGAEIKLIGTATVGADAKDKSGLSGDVMKNDGVTPNLSKNDTFGGAGSGIAYAGKGDVYLQVSDRGPSDGDALYACRVHAVHLKIDSASVSVEIEKTTLLKNEKNQNLVGSSRQFYNDLRFDPEAVRLAANGKDFFVADEYGPLVFKFSPDGKKIGELAVPKKFLIEQRSESGDQETKTNESGRVSNRGIEGIAVAPDGKKLLAIMQGALIQDTKLEADGKRLGTCARIIEFDLAGGKTRELLYPMEDARFGLHEILAINDHEFLVIERDTKEGKKAEFKKIYRIDIAKASDISAIEKLPPAGIPAGVTPVSKSVFIDLLDPKFGLAGDKFPDKIEGLAFGPDVGGKHTLIVTNDNDFRGDTANYYWVFTMDASDLPGYMPQKFE